MGRPLKRKEDPKILTGRTRYVDDIRLPGMLHAAVLRSSYAHAMITNIDISRALQMPSTKLVLLARDIPRNVKPLSTFEADDGSEIDRPILAVDEVRYVGEPIAFVVSESSYQAEDAIEAIGVDYKPLGVIVDPELAEREDSPRCHSGRRNNLVMVDKVESGNVEEAFAKAEKIVTLNLLNQRLSPSPLEPKRICCPI